MADGFRSILLMDSDAQYLGNSPGADLRGRLHVLVANTTLEPVPVAIVDSSMLPLSSVNVFATASAVPSGSEVLIATYTVPPAKTFHLVRVDISGDNVAKYNLYVNALVIAKRRTWFGGNISETIEFLDGHKVGLKLIAGDVIEIKVFNYRPDPADFDGRIQGVLEG